MDEELKEIEKMRKIPKEIRKKIDSKVYESILISTSIMLVCVLMLFRIQEYRTSFIF